MEDLFSLASGRTFPLQKGTPPPRSRSSDRKCSIDKETAYRTFEIMEVGDHFALMPPEGEHLIYWQNATSGAAATWSKAHSSRNPGVPKRVFTTRQMKGGWIACWRIK